MNDLTSVIIDLTKPDASFTLFLCNLKSNYEQGIMKHHKVVYYVLSDRDADWSIGGTQPSWIKLF